MAIEKVIKLDVQVDSGDINKLNTGLEQTADNLGDVAKEQDKVADSAKDAGKEAKDMNKGLADTGDAKKGLKAVGTGFKAIGTAIKAAGIGLVIGLFVLLKEKLEKVQPVMDFFDTVMTSISLVFNQVGDAIGDMKDRLTESSEQFDATKTVLKSLMTIALVPLKITFFTLKAALLGLKLAWQESFLSNANEEDIQATRDSLIEVGEDLVQLKDDVIESALAIKNNVGEMVDEMKDGVKIIAEEFAEIDIKAANTLAEQIIARKKANEARQAELAGIIAGYEQEAELERQKRDNVNLTIQERIEANTKLSEVLINQLAAQKEAAELAIQVARDQVTLNDNDENRNALLAAQGELITINNDITGKASEQLVNEIALKNELLALETSSFLAANERNKAQRDWEAERIENEEERIAKKIENLALDKEADDEAFERQISQLVEGTQMYQDALDAKLLADDEYLRAKGDLEEEATDRQIENDDKSAASSESLSDSRIAAGGDALTALTGYIDEETALGRALIISKQIFAAALLGIQIAQEINEAKALAKKAAIAAAEVALDVAKGTAKAAATLNPAVIVGWAISAAAIIASIISAVNAAKQVSNQPIDATLPSVDVSSPTDVATTGGTSPSPNFNVLGGSGVNQIAGAINSQNDRPIKTYVVSTEMTTQQELDRNIEDTAVL